MSSGIQATVSKIQVEQAIMKSNAKELSEKVIILDRKFDALDAKMDKVISTLDELTGAKKFAMALTGFVSACIVIAATWIGVHHK